MAKNRDLQAFKNQFHLLKDLTGVKFVIKLNRNLKKVNDELEILEKIHEEDEGVKKFREKGQELYRDYSEKNDDGSPKTETVQTFQGPVQKFVTRKVDEAELREKLKGVEEKFKEDIELQNEKEKDYVEALNVDSDIKFDLIEVEEIPDKITVEQMGLLTNIGMIKF